MAINIPSKSEKQRSQLVDALRILAWQQYKSENQVSGKDAYKDFSVEWVDHEIHQNSFKDIQKLIKSLEYTELDLMELRNEYYRRRDRATGKASIRMDINAEEPFNGDEPPY